MSRRGSSNPSPTYLPVARMTLASSRGMAASRSLSACRCFLPMPARRTTRWRTLCDELALEAVEMVVPLREHERRPPRVHRLDDVVADAPVARVVVHQLLVERLELHALVGVGSSCRLERRRLHEDEVLERSRRRLHSRIHAMPDRPALHEDDRVVAVLPRDGRRQPEDEPRLRLARDLFEAVRRQVVALVDDQVAVVGHAIIDDALPDQALNDRDIEQPGRRVSPAADAPNRLGGHAEERREALDPLIEQLAPMDEHERADAALSRSATRRRPSCRTRWWRPARRCRARASRPPRPVARAAVRLERSRRAVDRRGVRRERSGESQGLRACCRTSSRQPRGRPM